MPPPATAGPVPPRFRARRAKAATHIAPAKAMSTHTAAASNSAVPSIRARTHPWPPCVQHRDGAGGEKKESCGVRQQRTQPPRSPRCRCAPGRERLLCASSRTAMPIPARHRHPQASAPAIAFACKRSGASLATTMRQKRNVIAVNPAAANASPAKAISTCRWVPSNHSSHPPAWASSGALNWPVPRCGHAQPTWSGGEQESGEEQRDEAERHHGRMGEPMGARHK